jgi:hypothetical protein
MIWNHDVRTEVASDRNSAGSGSMVICAADGQHVKRSKIRQQGKSADKGGETSLAGRSLI